MVVDIANAWSQSLVMNGFASIVQRMATADRRLLSDSTVNPADTRVCAHMCTYTCMHTHAQKQFQETRRRLHTPGLKTRAITLVQLGLTAGRLVDEMLLHLEILYWPSH